MGACSIDHVPLVQRAFPSVAFSHGGNKPGCGKTAWPMMSGLRRVAAQIIRKGEAT